MLCDSISEEPNRRAFIVMSSFALAAMRSCVSDSGMSTEHPDPLFGMGSPVSASAERQLA